MSAPHSQNKWTKTGIERRRHPRKPPSAIPHLKAVRIVAGPEAKLINISRSGALIETEARLAPSSQIGLRLVTAEAVLMLKGRVVYSRTAALGSSTIRFQSAIEFDEELLLVDSDATPATQSDSTPPARPEPSAPEHAAPAPEDGESLVMLTANAGGSTSDLRDLFGLNNW
jgi:hypothetical protein